MSTGACILDLMSAAPVIPVSVGALIEAAALVDINDNQLRVTLARLRKRELLESPCRGFYQIGKNAFAIESEKKAWSQHRTVTWDGSWLVVYTADRPRSDRSRMRSELRALHRVGFREFRRGLFARPNNISGGQAGVSKRLTALGMQDPLCFATQDTLLTTSQAQELWTVKEWKKSTESSLQALERSRLRLKSAPKSLAARESFYLGREAMAQAMFDPCLPSPIGDEILRQRHLEAAKEYDAFGREIWAQAMTWEKAA